MADFELYGFAESGPCYRVAFMLRACGLDFAQRPVDFFNGETRTPEYRATINEMGEVPVLVHGQRKLAQSGAILAYLANLTGKFDGANEAEKLEILSWMLFDNHKLNGLIGTLRFMVAVSKSGETPVTGFLRQRVTGALGIVEAHLAKRSFMVGERVTIADFSLCAYLYMPEDYGIDWEAYPEIRQWLARLKAVPGWQAPYDILTRASPKRG
ncbi:MAG: glutathione S-transferase N-terminal domain-containing protein [Hyphomicrobiales bacterium]|nr:glutathione S-transferase N-terminal domain-containing protein [Hyphomicrobiales bacterium]